jgi:site-specific DNA-adenine methylase
MPNNGIFIVLKGGIKFMFETAECVNFEIGKITFSNGRFNVTVNMVTNHENIEESVKELKKSLYNLRKLINKDFVLVVTRDKVQFMSQDDN